MKLAWVVDANLLANLSHTELRHREKNGCLLYAALLNLPGNGASQAFAKDSPQAPFGYTRLFGNFGNGNRFAQMGVDHLQRLIQGPAGVGRAGEIVDRSGEQRYDPECERLHDLLEEVSLVGEISLRRERQGFLEGTGQVGLAAEMILMAAEKFPDHFVAQRAANFIGAGLADGEGRIVQPHGGGFGGTYLVKDTRVR